MIITGLPCYYPSYCVVRFLFSIYHQQRALSHTHHSYTQPVLGDSKLKTNTSQPPESLLNFCQMATMNCPSFITVNKLQLWSFVCEGMISNL